jgi:hypothetical protein
VIFGFAMLTACLQATSMLDRPPDGLRVEMVLPVRIELTTSALPRMRSTTELRQHVVRERAPMATAPAPVNLAGPKRGRHVAQMTGKDKEREERLATALRDNLKRRKAQARAQADNQDDDRKSGTREARS